MITLAAVSVLLLTSQSVNESLLVQIAANLDADSKVQSVPNYSTEWRKANQKKFPAYALDYGEASIIMMSGPLFPEDERFRPQLDPIMARLERDAPRSLSVLFLRRLFITRFIVRTVSQVTAQTEESLAKERSLVVKIRQLAKPSIESLVHYVEYRTKMRNDPPDWASLLKIDDYHLALSLPLVASVRDTNLVGKKAAIALGMRRAKLMKYKGLASLEYLRFMDLMAKAIRK